MGLTISAVSAKATGRYYVRKEAAEGKAATLFLVPHTSRCVSGGSHVSGRKVSFRYRLNGVSVLSGLDTKVSACGRAAKASLFNYGSYNSPKYRRSSYPQLILTARYLKGALLPLLELRLFSVYAHTRPLYSETAGVTSVTPEAALI